MSAPFARHPVVAGIVGFLAGGLVIALVEFLSQQVLGTPDLKTPQSVSASMFAAVLVAWIAGAGAAALVGTAWCGGSTHVPGWVAAGVLMAGSVATMLAFPHPGWMVAGAALLMPSAAWLGTRQGASASRRAT